MHLWAVHRIVKSKLIQKFIRPMQLQNRFFFLQNLNLCLGKNNTLISQSLLKQKRIQFYEILITVSKNPLKILYLTKSQTCWFLLTFFRTFNLKYLLLNRFNYFSNRHKAIFRLKRSQIK